VFVYEGGVLPLEETRFCSGSLKAVLHRKGKDQGQSSERLVPDVEFPSPVNKPKKKS
jgi:hypothetical protein